MELNLHSKPDKKPKEDMFASSKPEDFNGVVPDNQVDYVPGADESEKYSDHLASGGGDYDVG